MEALILSGAKATRLRPIIHTFPKLEFSSQQIINLESGFKLFCLRFGFSFGINSILIEFNQ